MVYLSFANCVPGGEKCHFGTLDRLFARFPASGSVFFAVCFCKLINCLPKRNGREGPPASIARISNDCRAGKSTAGQASSGTLASDLQLEGHAPSWPPLDAEKTQSSACGREGPRPSNACSKARECAPPSPRITHCYVRSPDVRKKHCWASQQWHPRV